MFKKNIVLVLVVFVIACTGKNKNGPIPIDDFFKAQDRSYYHVAPDGANMSYLKLQNGFPNIFVEDLKTGTSTRLTNLQDKVINFYTWTSNNELIYYAEDESKDRKSDLVILNKDGSNRIQIISNEKTKIKVLDEQLLDKKYLMVASNKRDSTVYDVYRLNIKNGEMKIIAKNPGNIIEWKTDDQGLLRIAIASDGLNQTLLYRKSENEKFKPVITNNFKTYLNPIALANNEPNVLYAISNIDRDKNGLIALDLNNGKVKYRLFGNDSLNVVDVRYSKTKRKILYVTTETWKKENYYLDDSTKQIYQKLDALLPETEWRIMDKDKLDNIFVIRTFTDRNPGSYYLFESKTSVLKKISEVNSSIKVEEMSPMMPISYKTKDSLTINGYLTLPINLPAVNLPVVVIPHNGPGGRNTWAYNADVQFLANRGYAVLQVNYRGSVGYGREFYVAGFKQWSDKIQEDVNDGVRWLISKKIANPKKVAIYGTGLGGYIALNCLFKNPDIYACGGSNAGVINLFSYFKTIPPILTARLQMYYEILGNPITDTEFMRFSSPVFHAERFKKPIFIAQNPKDPQVNIAECVQFVKELKKRKLQVVYVEKEEGPNPVKRQQGRQIMYKALEEFLKQNLNKAS
jgi:dipeptidyl aminopeptidase/acylaminoacyl peptidase